MTLLLTVCVSLNLIVISALRISCPTIMVLERSSGDALRLSAKRKRATAPVRGALPTGARSSRPKVAVINIDKTSGAWLLNGKAIEYPDQTLPALEQKCRFSADFNAHFNQMNPVALMQGTLDALNTLAASRSIMTKKEHASRAVKVHTDTADYLVPMQLPTLRAASAAIRNKNYEGAYDILSLHKLGDESRLMRRGRKIEVDGRVSLIKQSWLSSSYMLVSVVLYPDLIKIGLFGGKRDCKLTTKENMAYGGETSKQACVREVQEESGLTIAEDMLRNIGQQDTRSSTIFYSVAV